MTRYDRVNQLVAEAQGKLQEAEKVLKHVTSAIEEKAFKDNNDFLDFQSQCLDTRTFLNSIITLLTLCPKEFKR